MKNELRKQAKEIRKRLNTAEFSQKLTRKIRECGLYKDARNVLLYYPLKYEMDFLELLNDNKNFYFPRVNGSDMLICPYSVGENLEKSSLGILEPCTTPCSPEVLDIAIVPALLVDTRGYRLGYGGGFYDRFLSSNKKIKTICAIPECLTVDKLPIEPFDIPTDIVIKTS